MGPHFKIASKSVKPTIKFLAGCSDPRLQRMILRSASDSVYKSICNAFFNVAENPDINLTKHQKKIFKRHYAAIRQIISPKLKLQKKKRIIQRGSGVFLAALLPAVLSSALSFLGSAFINRKEE